jgi:hypothetical protein
MNEQNYFTITIDEAKQLYQYLSKQYISYEHYPLVINLTRALRDIDTDGPSKRDIGSV